MQCPRCGYALSWNEAIVHSFNDCIRYLMDYQPSRVVDVIQAYNDTLDALVDYARRLLEALEQYGDNDKALHQGTEKVIRQAKALLDRWDSEHIIGKKPAMIRRHVFWCQVCVPSDWTDENIVAFAEREYPCGTENGWHLVKPGEESACRVEGQAIVACEDRKGFVHRILVA